MCGIAGIYYFDRSMRVDKYVLSQMRDVMKHRGPDDKGLFVDNFFGFAHRRLSIIDLSTGKQPLANEDESIWVCFNGEIYNYQELRESLLARGHVFRTNSDTECLVHLYEEYGFDFVAKLNGMFAIALWDSKMHRLIVVRDRLGIKPLYYFCNNNVFLFASEIKSILKFPGFKPEINIEALKEYMVFRYLSGGRTMFKNVKRLLPGHMLIVRGGGNIQKRVYWDLELGCNENGHGFDEAIERIDSLMQQSVNYRLIADVPVGTYCSGGIDSSIVTALAAKRVDNAVETFCVGFDASNWDERPFSRLTANRYNTKHHELVIRENDFVEYMERLNWYFDEPISHPNSVPLYHLSRYARKYVKVVLTGEGADELFGGYPRHYMVLLYQFLSKVHGGLPKAFSVFLRCVPQRKMRKLAWALQFNRNGAVIFNSAFNYVQDVDKLLISDSSSDSVDYLDYRLRCFQAFVGKEDLTEALMNFEIKTYLVSALERLDKMSMATGLEARVPLLDHNIVEYVTSLPRKYKLHRLQNKYIFKKYAEQYIDHEVINGSKSGFGVPLCEWFRNLDGLGGFVMDLQKSDSPVQQYCDNHALKNVINAHMGREKDYSELLWVLVNLNLFLKVF